jgi:hypothetical protein
LGDDELLRKFRRLADGLSDERRRRIEIAIAELDQRHRALETLLESVLSVGCEPANFPSEREGFEPVIGS